MNRIIGRRRSRLRVASYQPSAFNYAGARGEFRGGGVKNG